MAETRLVERNDCRPYNVISRAPPMVKGEKLLGKINGTTTRVENNGEYNVFVVADDGAWIR